MNQEKQHVHPTEETSNWYDSSIQWSLDSVASWIRFAEIKVAAILAITGILISALLDRLPYILTAAETPCLILRRCIFSTLVVYASAQLGVIISALLVLWPRLRPSRRSLFYFGDIASMSYEDFRDAYSGSDVATLREHALRQVYDASRIARAKFLHTRYCIALLIVSFLAWMILLLMTSF